ncbi:DUF746 domain-containing protein [Brucella intermedia]|uniref:DUF746 domain-containing protein n=1 Tax=Brucella intermedia TaxID=94625 RepID=UPI00124CE800|nr:DUF746 domain-containing protein [Brucella intermedia]KAB2719217.1 DUF746 domain-containing protein [Brucella intermedia]
MSDCKRHFDPMVPRFERKRMLPDTEDAELTAFLEREIADIHSLSGTPPRCPHCEGGNTVLATRAAKPKPALPVFRCLACDVHFRRTTGTAIAGLRVHQPWFRTFLKLLSQQRPANDAARILGTKAVTVVRYVQRFRQWLLELDPPGYFEAKVRLGLEIRPDIACPSCQAMQSVRYRGFHPLTGQRRCWCDQCGCHFRLDLETGRNGDFLQHRIFERPPSPFRKKVP